MKDSLLKMSLSNNSIATIGIMSMQRIDNYGSFLQAYALKKTIESLGFNVVFVDYRVGKPLVTNKAEKRLLLAKYLANMFKKVVVKLWFFAFLFPLNVRQSVFSSRNHNKYIKKYLNVYSKKYSPNLNVLVIGSDEVFNCTQLNPDVGFSPELFGENANAKTIISYAASFGNTTLQKIESLNIINKLSMYLNNFNSLSVRDENSYNIVLKLSGRKPIINLDPVLIYDFSKAIIETRDVNNYVIVYAYRGRITKEEEKIIVSFSRKERKKIIAIGGFHKFADINIVCSPFEVLGYFKNADYIFTDTFHGTIFSIISHKKFVTFVREKGNNGYGNSEKLSDLLQRLRLEDRSVNICDDVISILVKDIDYYIVDSIIANEKDKTFDYLKRNLCEIK